MTSGVIPMVGREFQSLGDHVHSALLNLIVERRVEPGARLMLDDLAASLGVSRTPVQYALSQLAVEGLVEHVGRRGYRVTVVAPLDVVHLYDARLMFELYAVDRSAQRLTPALVGQLESLDSEQYRLASSPDPQERLLGLQRDGELHSAIVGLGGNPRVVAMQKRLNIHVQAARIGPSPYSFGELAWVTHAEHTEIIRCLACADLTAAKNSISLHIAKALARVLARHELIRRAELETAQKLEEVRGLIQNRVGWA